jgi:hypothetical protein
MMREDYQHIRCHVCGWKGWSDGPSCEGQCADEAMEAMADAENAEEEGDTRCTLRSYKYHTARKTYNEGKTNEVRPGDRYQRQVEGGYEVNGPRWLHVTRVRVTKGPAWAA